MKEKIKKNKERGIITMEKQRLRKNKGITLIALVITIIVLLIHAGVSIAMLTGNNGILTQAQNAKKQTDIASEKEAVSLAYTTAYAKNNGEGKVTYSQMQDALDDNGTNAEASGNIIVYFPDSERYYTVKDGVVEGPFEEKPETELSAVEMFENGQNCDKQDGTCTDETHLHIGDYVNYEEPTSGEPCVIGPSQTGVENYQVYSLENNDLNWRVLGIEEENGEKRLKLVADSPVKRLGVRETEKGETITEGVGPYFDIYGAEGYLYAPDAMDAISQIFKNDDAYEARSMNINDINQALGKTTDEQIKEKNFLTMQGFIQYKESYGPFEGQWTPEDWLKQNRPTSIVSGEVSAYAYLIDNGSLPSELSGIATTVENERLRSMLFDNVEPETGKAYWLASRGVYASSDGSYARFGPGFVSTEGGMTCCKLGGDAFCSDGREYGRSDSAAVRPVVILNSDVLIEKIEDQPDSWQ